MARWKARNDFVFVIIRLFSLCLTVKTLQAEIGRNKKALPQRSHAMREKAIEGHSRLSVVVSIDVAYMTSYIYIGVQY